MSEEEIIGEIGKGGRASHVALRAWLFGPLGRHMRQFFVHKGASGADAEDILQDTIVNVVAKIGTFRGDGDARSWLWQIARNSLIDHFRKAGAARSGGKTAEAAIALREAAANDAEVSFENEVKVTRLHYVGKPASDNTDPASPRQMLMDEDQWRVIEETVAAPPDGPLGESVDECVSLGLEAFAAQNPERAYVLGLQMDGSGIPEIADRIGRTVRATTVYLSECRKKVGPFIARCAELLPA